MRLSSAAAVRGLWRSAPRGEHDGQRIHAPDRPNGSRSRHLRRRRGAWLHVAAPLSGFPGVPCTVASAGGDTRRRGVLPMGAGARAQAVDGTKGRWRVRNLIGRPVHATLRVELNAFEHTRTLDVRLADVSIQLNVVPDRRAYSMVRSCSRPVTASLLSEVSNRPPVPVTSRGATIPGRSPSCSASGIGPRTSDRDVASASRWSDHSAHSFGKSGIAGLKSGECSAQRRHYRCRLPARVDGSSLASSRSLPVEVSQ